MNSVSPLPQHNDLNRLRVPRYTSYPTAPHFKEAQGDTLYRDWLSTLPADRPVSLYFHIPFCDEMCNFCGCYTKITKKYKPIKDNINFLLKEIRLTAKALGNRKPAVKHIHFGGGSPTILLPEDFIRIMEAVKQHFIIDNNAEIAVEIDPRTVDEAKIEAYAKMGVNRASMGVQDFNEKVQKTVNRIQPYTVVKQTVGWLQRHNITNLNMDLMYGLPYQTIDIVKHTTEQALTLNPDRIALFGYAHVPWMKKHMRLIPEEALAGAEARMDMFEAAKQTLLENGFISIGLDHFTRATDSMARALKNHTLHRNFQGYTTDDCDILIGMGVSSISSLPQGYVQNISPFKEYEEAIEAGKLPIVKQLPISDEDIKRRAIIEQLMCYMELDLTIIEGDFSYELSLLETLEKEGKARIDGQGITIPEEARLHMREVCSVFDQYLNPGEQRHSYAV